MSDPTNGRDGTYIECRAIHERRIHLHFAIGIQHRAVAGIEAGIVLQYAYGRLSGIQRSTTVMKYRSTHSNGC